MVGSVAALAVLLASCVPETEDNGCIRIGVSCGQFKNYHDYAGPYFDGVGTVGGGDDLDVWEFGPPGFYGNGVALPGGTADRRLSLVLPAGTTVSVSACEFLAGPWLGTYVGIACQPRGQVENLSCAGPDSCTMPAVLTFNILSTNWQPDRVGIVLAVRGTGTYTFRLDNQ